MNFEKVIIHFNVTNFPSSVEQAVDTALKERPLIIAPSEDPRSLVYDMNEIAYREGIRRGMSRKKAFLITPRAVFRTPRPELYRRAMNKMAGIISHYSPLLERGEADGHFFLDLTGCRKLWGAPADTGIRINREVREGLGLQPVWGLASNKLVAKTATRLVKPGGECIVPSGGETSFLAPLPVALLPGLKTGELERLKELEIHRIGQLASISRQELNIPFPRRGDFIFAAARGIDHSRVIPEDRGGQPKIYCGYSFSEDTNDALRIRAGLAKMVQEGGYGLRASGLKTLRAGIFILYSDGREIVRQASVRRGVSDNPALLELAARALRSAWFRRIRIRSLRLVFDRCRPDSGQLPLFAEEEEKESKKRKLMESVDLIRTRYGENGLVMGSSLILQ